MPESTEQSRTCTDAPRVTLLPQQPRTDAPISITPPSTGRGEYDGSFDRFLHHADRAFGDGAA